MPNDDDQLKNITPSLSDDDDQQQGNQTQSDLEAAVEELMQDFDLDPEQAEKLKQLEDEGYDEEDALGKVLDA